MKVRWSEGADLDRGEIVHMIWLDNPAAAQRMDDLFTRAVDRLGEFPQLGRERSVPGTRELIPHSNYRIVYVIESDEIVILTLLHAKRQWPPEPGE